MRKIIPTLLSGVLALTLCACGGSAPESGTEAPAAGSSQAAVTEEAAGNAEASAKAPEGESAAPAESQASGSDAGSAAADGLNVCLSGEPITLDPALNSASDGSTIIIHLFSGLAKWGEDSEGNAVLEEDCAAELVEPVMNEDGTVTYTYTLRDGLKWSDGKPVTAGDFVFSWNRAASPATMADYAYMFSVIDGYEAMWKKDGSGNFANPDAKLNIKATDDSTLEVTLINSIPYWSELLAFPAYMPVREDVVASGGWAGEAASFVNNGPYCIDSWEHGKMLKLRKNESYIDASEVTMPAINFFMSEDDVAVYNDFKNGKLQMIDVVPTAEISKLKEENSPEFNVVSQLGTYYFCWNVNKDILPENSKLTGKDAEQARENIRNALSLIIDRDYAAENIGQAGQAPAATFVPRGLTDADGSQFCDNAGSDRFSGYFDVSPTAYQGNRDMAMEVLKKYYSFDEASGKFTDFPKLNYIYNTSDAHRSMAEYVQKVYGEIGLELELKELDWDTFLECRKNGDFDLARNGWMADYNDPVSFLDSWVSYSGNDDTQMGKGANADMKAYDLDLTELGYETLVTDGTWAETYDVLIDHIKSCTDTYTRYALMHKAEDLLMSTGTICPLYYYTDVFMMDTSVSGVYTSPLGLKFFMHATVD